jgi:exodeoxyribonuclease VII large subunit
MDTKEHISLLELLGRVKGAIEREVSSQLWIKAEISDIKNHSAGHCYLELVDTGKDGDEVEARAQGIIWSSVYKMLKPYFETTTGYQLARGMHILVKAQVQFSTLYGLSLIISDLNPSFTIGELEIERQKSILKLKEEGMFEMNKELEIPKLPRKFAVISSESAAGYLDFIKHLHENEYGYRFQTTLFTAPMQGEAAPAGIIEAMDRVAQNLSSYDALLILRGGGSTQDLRCFDDYELAVNIAQFPLPVITGIGHEQDFHIADMVANTYLKTPTAIANFIVDKFSAEEGNITSIAARLSLSLRTRIINEENRLRRVADALFTGCKSRYINEQHAVELLEQKVVMNNPLALLAKGYALVLKEREKVISADALKAGDEIDVVLQKGTVECLVKKLK